MQSPSPSLTVLLLVFFATCLFSAKTNLAVTLNLTTVTPKGLSDGNVPMHSSQRNFAATAANGTCSLLDQDEQSFAPPGAESATPFQRHVLGTYQSALDRSKNGKKPKFLLFNMNDCGWGNVVRSLNGAIFVAALTDRVLLVSTPRLMALFDPPAVGGVEIGWNVSAIDTQNECNRSDATIYIGVRFKDRNIGTYASEFVKFDQRYGNTPHSPRCLLYMQPYGWDR